MPKRIHASLKPGSTNVEKITYFFAEKQKQIQEYLLTGPWALHICSMKSFLQSTIFVINFPKFYQILISLVPHTISLISYQCILSMVFFSLILICISGSAFCLKILCIISLSCTKLSFCGVCNYPILDGLKSLFIFNNLSLWNLTDVVNCFSSHSKVPVGIYIQNTSIDN